VVHFAHPVFSVYRSHTALWCKRLIRNALLDVLGFKPLLTHDGPSSMVATVTRQEAEGRTIVHLMHYIPERRGDFDVIEDAIPLHEVECVIRTGDAVSVRLVPGDVALRFTVDAGAVTFRVPRVQGHQMIEII
jgi:hypothetical protein